MVGGRGERREGGDTGVASAADPPPVLADAMCGTLATYLRMCGRISDGIDPPEYVPDPAADVDRDESDVPRRFWHCHDCGRWFWKGSHWARVADRLADL